jgi:hypothetical protein
LTNETIMGLMNPRTIGTAAIRRTSLVSDASPKYRDRGEASITITIAIKNPRAIETIHAESTSSVSFLPE